MPLLFVSYRRREYADLLGRLFDRLTAHWGAGSVFVDIHSIQPGEDFRESIARSIGQTRAVLVMIGPDWANLADNHGRPRLANPTDFVRLEIEAALRCGRPLVPVLIAGAEMPPGDQLPDSLIELTFRNAMRVRSGDDFDADVNQLIGKLDLLLGAQKRRALAGPLSADGQQRQPATPGSGRFAAAVLALSAAVLIGAALGAFWLYGLLRPTGEGRPPGPDRTASLTLLQTLNDGQPCHLLAVHPGGRRVATAHAETGELTVWDVAAGRPEFTLKPDEMDIGMEESEPGTAFKLAAFHPSLDRLLVVTDAGGLTAVDLSTQKRLATVPAEWCKKATQLEYLQAGRVALAVARCEIGDALWDGAEGGLDLFDPDSGKRVGSLMDAKDGDGKRVLSSAVVGRLVLSPDGKWALTPHDDGGLRLWELATRSPLRKFETPSALARRMPPVEDPLRKSKDKDGAKKEGKAEAKAPPPMEDEDTTMPLLRSTDYSRGGATGLVGEGNGPFPPSGGAQVGGLNLGGAFRGGGFNLGGGIQLGGPGAMAGFIGGPVSPGGVVSHGPGSLPGGLGFGGQFGQLGQLGGAAAPAGTVWNPRYGLGHFDPHGQTIIAVTNNSDVHVRDFASGRIVREINVRGADAALDDAHAIRAAAFSPDGQTLVTAGEDRAVRFWDFSTGKRIYTHEGNADSVVRLHFSSDGHTLITFSAGGVVRVWSVRIGGPG